MKKVKLILMVFGLLATIISSGQTTLTFRLANPRVEYTSGTNYFAFDIQAKAAVAGSYLFSGQAVLSFANGSLSNTSGDWGVVNSTLLAGTFGIGNSKYNPSILTLTGSPLKANIAWTSNSGSVGQPATSARFNEVTTSFQTLVTVYAPITDATAVAGIDFDEASMNGQQSYKIDASPWFAAYLSPNAYDAADFMTTYLGRIYANGNWTQYGGSLNWATAVGTSVYDGAATIATPGICYASSLRIHTGATLTVPPTGSLTAGPTEIVPANGLVVQSDATGTGSLITGDVTGTAIVNRYLTGDQWHLISSPVSGQTIPLFAAASSLATNGTMVGLGYYDNTIPNWVTFTTATLPGAGTFVAGKGYEVKQSGSTGTISYTGTPGFGGITSAVASTGDQWNVVGNPYASAIFANQPASGNNFLDANMDRLAAEYGAIYTWNGTKYDVINNLSAATIIPADQGFFVRVADATSPASFTYAMRTHSTTAFKSGQSSWPSLNVKANIAGISRSTGIYYVSGMTLGVDKGYDAAMFDAFGKEDVAVFTRIPGSDIDFAIQSLPDYDYENIVVPVGLNASQGAAVIFTADVTDLPAGIKVYLEDRVLGKFTRLDEGGSYSTTASSVTDGTERFFIHTTQGTLGVVDQLLSDITITAMPREHKIRIVGTTTSNSVATIYDLSGRAVGTQVLPNVGENEMPFSPLSNGIYIMKVQQTGMVPTSVKINWIY